MALDWTQCAQWSAQTGFITHTREIEWYSRNKKCGQNCCITFIGELTGTFSPQTPKFFPNLVWSDKFKCCDFYDSLCDAFFATFLACLAIYFITQDFLVTLLLEGYLQMSSLQNCKALAWITGGNHCIYGFNSISPVMINVEIVSIYHSKNHFQKERDRCHSFLATESYWPLLCEVQHMLSKFSRFSLKMLEMTWSLALRQWPAKTSFPLCHVPVVEIYKWNCPMISDFVAPQVFQVISNLEYVTSRQYSVTIDSNGNVVHLPL